MEQFWMEQPWLVAGGAGAVLLVIVVWLLLHRRSKPDQDLESEASAEVSLTEPTLAPAAPETAEPDTRPAEGSESPPDRRDTGESPEDRIVEGRESGVPVTETPVSASEVDAAQESAPEDLTEKEATERSDYEPEPSPVTDPEFIAAREAFEHELLTGNFSRLDVFAAYERTREDAGSPNLPRSEYFHGVVNRALEIRDAFEALLRDEDRKQFVDVHSRYLDDVTEEEDAETREQLHRQHRERLAGLRPKSAGSPENN